MRRGDAIQIVGIEELKRNLGDLLPREAQNVLRQAAVGVANDIRDEIRANMPENVRHYRTAIATYRPRVGRGQVAADVVAKRSPPRPFYIHNIIEAGTEERYTKAGAPRGRVRAQPFKRPVIERWRRRVPARFQEVLAEKLAAFWEKRRTGEK